MWLYLTVTERMTDIEDSYKFLLTGDYTTTIFDGVDKNLDKNGRLLLMSFLSPIINGKGFMFKENVIAEDRKMDLVITYNDKRYVIELKIWYGEKYLSDGIEQLCESYLGLCQFRLGDWHKSWFQSALMQFQLLAQSRHFPL
jgi:hypothetical protein